MFTQAETATFVGCCNMMHMPPNGWEHNAKLLQLQRDALNSAFVEKFALCSGPYYAQHHDVPHGYIIIIKIRLKSSH